MVGFQCSLSLFFCPYKYSILNQCITGLIVRGEHEAREAGKELTTVLLLCLVAGFLAKGFLAWI